MLRLIEIARDLGGLHVAGVLTLAFGDRRRSRLRSRLDDGREVALMLPRGTLLRDGDRLRAEEEALVVVVRAANEMLSWVRADNRLLLARAAYHLGNRHVPVQIGPGWLAYEHDHVLDGMIEEMGLPVEARRAPFEPEAGGYRHGTSEPPAHGGHHHHDH
ncbi:MAG TPA: urease accessory protein UreE [Polyangia bacterium]|jgi:urease accessory protein|nr:urease accessory protein UreE [Polyangia bacterium]